MRFAIFPVHRSKLLRLPRKSDARSYVLHLSRKIISANLKIWCSKMQPLSGNQRPDLLTALMNMSLVLCLPREMHLCRSSSNATRLPWFLEMLQNSHVLLTFEKVHNPLRLRNKIWTSQSGANMWCSVHFDFEMCFAPQRRALFRHRNFQKWSDAGVLCTFWLRNLIRATTACTFSTSQLPKVVRTWGAFSFFTYTCASRHNGVHFFIAHLARWLCTRRFSEPTFRPSGAPNHGNNRVFRDFPTFSRICIFFLLILYLLWSALFLSSLLSASAHLCFSSVHIVGSLTSKLPSTIIYNYIYIYIYIREIDPAPPRLRHFHTWLQMQTRHLLHFLGVGGLLKHLQLQMWTSVGMQKLPGEIGHEVELVVPAAKFHTQSMLTPRDCQMEVS